VRFRHDLVDLAECPVLDPSLFALVDELRLAAGNLLPLGGAAEAMLTRTDSGLDMLFEVAERPGLAVLEALAGLAERCDLARIVWRSSAEEMLVVERRPVQARFCRRAKRPKPSSSGKSSQASGRSARCSICTPGSELSLSRWPRAGRYMQSREMSAL